MGNFLDQSFRLDIIGEINGEENKQRKLLSVKQSNIQQDKIYQYVLEYLETQFESSTVQEMPVIANVNLQRRISKQEASIYKESPVRVYSDLDDNQTAVLDSVYMDGGFNSKFRFSNEAFKYQQQNHLMCVPVNGRLTMRVLKSHQLDVIPDPRNPEAPLAYIVSNFDFSNYDKLKRSPKRTGHNQGRPFRDGVNQKIGDNDDMKSEAHYLVWTKEYNFIMNGKGEFIDPESMQPYRPESEEEIKNPLGEFGLMPFIDISGDKEFEYWVRQGESLTDATIIYNSIFSSESQIVNMQGFAQAFMKASPETQPQNIKVGVNSIVFLPVDENTKVDPEFGFVSPNADLTSIREFRESYLASFLSSRGVDPKSISGTAQANKFSSGIERLLSLIEKFEASKEDMDIYEKAEKELYQVIVAWLKVLNGSDLLDKKYQTGLPEETEVFVEYARPEVVMTEGEKLDLIERKMELGLISRVDALAELQGLDREEAEAKAAQIDKDELGEGRGTQAEVQ